MPLTRPACPFPWLPVSPEDAITSGPVRFLSNLRFFTSLMPTTITLTSSPGYKAAATAITLGGGRDNALPPEETRGAHGRLRVEGVVLKMSGAVELSSSEPLSTSLADPLMVALMEDTADVLRLKRRAARGAPPFGSRRSAGHTTLGR